MSATCILTCWAASSLSLTAGFALGARWPKEERLDGAPCPPAPRLRRKPVYLDDDVIGEASTWGEAERLLTGRRVERLASEGPAGFYFSAAP